MLKEGVPTPKSVTLEIGGVITWSAPALEIGFGFGSTIIFTSFVAFAPLLSVTVNRITYVPTTVNPETFVVADDGVPNEIVAGPLMLVHAYAAIVPSESMALPVKLVVVVGSIIFLSSPALEVGGWFVILYSLFSGFT